MCVVVSAHHAYPLYKAYFSPGACIQALNVHATNFNNLATPASCAPWRTYVSHETSIT